MEWNLDFDSWIWNETEQAKASLNNNWPRILLSLSAVIIKTKIAFSPLLFDWLIYNSGFFHRSTFYIFNSFAYSIWIYSCLWRQNWSVNGIKYWNEIGYENIIYLFWLFVFCFFFKTEKKKKNLIKLLTNQFIKLK